MKNNQLILLILSSCILLILSSCTSTRQLHQDKTRLTTETSTHETTLTNTQVLSNIRVTETQDTSILFTGSELISSAKFNSLLAGDTIYATDVNLSLKTFYDSLTKTIKTQATSIPKTVSFKYHKITEKHVVQSGIVTSNIQSHQKQTIQSENKDKQVELNSLPPWSIIVIIILIIGFIGFLILKFKRYL